MDATSELSQYHQQFLQDLKAKGRAGATVIAYGKDIEQFIEFLRDDRGKTTIAAVESTDIELYKDSLGVLHYTDKSIYRKINSIKSFFRFLRGIGVITDNPANTVSHPKYDLSDPRVLTKLEYRALRDACRADKRISTIVEVLLQTGMRISELANLEIEDVDFENNSVKIRPQESHTERMVPLNNAAVAAIKEYLEIRPKTRQKALFVTKTCRPFLVRNIRTAIDRYFRLAGIKDAKVNDLRHTFIVQQLAAGTPLVYVSQLVGHKRITTTEKYLKLLQNSADFQTQMKVEEL
ncbi:MAG: tyrosine-type recombinase/integrase [Candidatus Woesebacteria bacterium]